MNTFAGIMIPFIGTTAGVACMFFLKNVLKPRVQKAFLGFASGVVAAAPVWSLLISPMNMNEHLSKMVSVPALVGFLLGTGLLFLLDEVTPHLRIDTDEPEGPRGNWKKNTMLVLAVALHNMPEGMAVGAASTGPLSEDSSTTMAGVLALSVDIAIQNFPEGVIISLPLRGVVGKEKVFVYGMLSGIVKPIGAFLMLALFEVLGPVLPYSLLLTAGAMIYVVVGELTPGSTQGEHSNVATIGFIAGFVVMMILDVVLGWELHH